jgi:hypothetical protein
VILPIDLIVSALARGVTTKKADTDMSARRLRFMSELLQQQN